MIEQELRNCPYCSSDKLEALYREEIKTKKQDALRERADIAEDVLNYVVSIGDELAKIVEGISKMERTVHEYNMLSRWNAFMATGRIPESEDEKKTKNVTCKDCKHSKYYAGIAPRLAVKYNFADTNPYPTHKCMKYDIVRRRTNLSRSIMRLAICIRDNGGEQADKS